MKETEETCHLNAQENYLLSRNRQERLCAPAIAAAADCFASSSRVVAIKYLNFHLRPYMHTNWATNLCDFICHMLFSCSGGI